jgi:hypothetical protein
MRRLLVPPRGKEYRQRDKLRGNDKDDESDEGSVVKQSGHNTPDQPSDTISNIVETECRVAFALREDACDQHLEQGVLRGVADAPERHRDQRPCQTSLEQERRKERRESHGREYNGHPDTIIELAFEDAGEQSLKNIAWPVHLYRVRPSGAAAITRPSLPLPDKPSIAVLPFQNMSGDPEQEYFADGIVEEIITALSRFRQLFVIARNSTFTYKGRAVDVKQVGRELGVRYVLEAACARLRTVYASLGSLSML